MPSNLEIGVRTRNMDLDRVNGQPARFQGAVPASFLLAASREALRALRFLFAACAALPCLFVFGTLLVTLNRRERERVNSVCLA